MLFQGVATFYNCDINTVGTNFSLKATYAALPVGISGNFAITAKPTHLVWTTDPPVTVAAGATFSLAVTAENGTGPLGTDDSTQVALGNRFGEGNINCAQNTVTVQDGVANFTGCTEY